MNADEPGQDPSGAEDPRLTSLEERLKAAHDAEAVRTGSKHKKPSKGYSQGNRVLAELLAGLVGGALIGWLIDRWLDSSPWALLVSLFLGIAVAFRNIIRISNERPE
jgi:ATP synthase protein I